MSDLNLTGHRRSAYAPAGAAPPPQGRPIPPKSPDGPREPFGHSRQFRNLSRMYDICLAFVRAGVARSEASDLAALVAARVTRCFRVCGEGGDWRRELEGGEREIRLAALIEAQSGPMLEGEALFRAAAQLLPEPKRLVHAAAFAPTVQEGLVHAAAFAPVEQEGLF